MQSSEMALSSAPSETNNVRTIVARRYYVKHSIVPFEEDATHEFKGHANICIEDIPNYCVNAGASSKRSRQPISKTLNGFINTGEGGTVYCGILDSGSVKGIKLIQYKKDHYVASVDDCMGRFNPPVDKSRYEVRFIPVVEPNSSQAEISAICSYDSRKGVSLESRRREHLLRSQNYCWCDKESIALFNNNVIAPSYIIEICIKPWAECASMKNSSSLVNILSPYHEDEEGLCYFRRQASVVQYSLCEMIQFTRQDVQDYFKEKIKKLEEQLKMIIVSGNKIL
ncbi:unnamed protein product [Owenia fusiformis]|nr:unnamed protein product [Owenia fusiformis]